MIEIFNKQQLILLYSALDDQYYMINKRIESIENEIKLRGIDDQDNWTRENVIKEYQDKKVKLVNLLKQINSLILMKEPYKFKVR